MKKLSISTFILGKSQLVDLIKLDLLPLDTHTKKLHRYVFYVLQESGSETGPVADLCQRALTILERRLLMYFVHPNEIIIYKMKDFVKKQQGLIIIKSFEYNEEKKTPRKHCS